MATAKRNISSPADSSPPTRLIPVPDWNRIHPWPPIGGLRYLIFHEHSNGFSAVVRRCGRRVLIDETAFFDWVAKQNESTLKSRDLLGEDHV